MQPQEAIQSGLFLSPGFKNKDICLLLNVFFFFAIQVYIYILYVNHHGHVMACFFVMAMWPVMACTWREHKPSPSHHHK